MEARQIAASKDRLLARATGEVELEGKTMVLKRIHVRLELRCEPAQRETAQRVHGFFADACPLYRSLRAAIAITTELALVD
ncbi:MAG TPA: OsmC family protein [Anaeromyxobacteraceae bacterium]|nr:OsmC family protein [Anaeromyxobacteraceae bacterium]